jgi:hypothetical protein
MNVVNLYANGFLMIFSLISYFKKQSRLMRSLCWPCVSVYPPLSLLGNGSVKIPTTSCVNYEITLVSVCLSMRVHIIVSFSMRPVSYQRKVGD